MPHRRSFYLLLILVCWLGFALRLYRLDARPFWFDEGISVDLALAPPGYVLETIDRPPLYYLLLHAWVRVAGSTPFAYRFFSAWWGTLALVFFYLLARRLLERRAAVWALGLAIFSLFYIHYAQEARTYSLTLALALASSWALLAWLKDRREQWMTLYTLATVACLYTHYAALLLPIAHAAFMALTVRRDPWRWWRWLEAQLIVGLLFLPWPIYARRGLPELIAPQAQPSLLNTFQHGALFVWTTLIEFSAGQTLAWPVGEIIALVFVFFIVLGVIAPSLRGEARRFLLLLMVLPPIALWLLPRSAVYFSPKYLIVATPAFYLLAIAGLESLRLETPRVLRVCQVAPMTSNANRRILIALAVTLVIGVPLLVFGRAAYLPFLTGKIVQSYWADDLQEPTGIGYLENTAIANEGVTLSQLRRMPVYADDVTGVDSRGNIYLRFGDRFSVYHPDQGVLKELRPPSLGDQITGWNYFLGSDDKFYVIEHSRQDDQLLIYDPAIQESQRVGVIPYVRFLAEGVDARVYGFDRSPWPVFVFDSRSTTITPLDPPGETGLGLAAQVNVEVRANRQPIVLGEDGLLYGSAFVSHDSIIFALDLIDGTIITHTTPLPVVALTPRPGGGVYFGAGYNGLWVFDPSVEDSLITLPLFSNGGPFGISTLFTRSDDRLYGIGALSDTASGRFLFVYTPATGVLERLPTDVYSIRDVFVAPDDRIYGLSGNYLSIVQSGQYTTTGTLKSENIQPATVALTEKSVGGTSASVRDLACGLDGKLYGVKSDPLMRKWLFSYDPRSPESGVVQAALDVSAEQEGSFLSGTSLIALDDGRLVGGTNSGHLFVYDPATDETWDVGRPADESVSIPALATGRDGLVYGGTLSYDHRATLFAFDPASGAITNIDLPVPQATLIEAVTVGEDGRVYAGVDSTLVVYDPATQQATSLGYIDQTEPHCTIGALVTGPDGRIYGGCAARLFTYDPSDGSLSDLGDMQELGRIAGLTVGGDGRIYGSVQHEYMSRSGKYRTNKVFVYDPVERRMTNLGMGVATGPVVLAACGEGLIYGGSDTTNSNYSGPAYLFAFRTDCTTGLVGTWDKVTWQADTPPGTRLMVDVLSQSGQLLVGNVENGGSLQALDAASHPAIYLRANLFTSDPGTTPVLKNWRVDYTFTCNGDTQPRGAQR